MSEHDSSTRTPDIVSDLGDDVEDLEDAYEALAEDRHRQQNELAAQQRSSANSNGSSLPLVVNAPGPDDALAVENEPESSEVDDETGRHVATASPTNSSTDTAAATGSPVTPATTSNRRVFVIDGKEYPDPDSALPITGARSVQAMYRDYFPGQLDNVDVVQKTRTDGTLEVMFKRRIGTKGARVRASRRSSAAGSGEVVVTVGGVARVLAALPKDRPLAWDLVEQAIGPDGAVRLDFVPDPAQLNLAEAQQSARVRLIGLAVDELVRLRPRI